MNAALPRWIVFEMPWSDVAAAVGLPGVVPADARLVRVGVDDARLVVQFTVESAEFREVGRGAMVPCAHPPPRMAPVRRPVPP